MKTILSTLSITFLLFCFFPIRSAKAGAIPQLPASKVTDMGLRSGNYAQYPIIVADDSTLYAVWQDDRVNDYPFLFYAKSTDGGNTWSANQRLTKSHWPSNPFTYPEAAVSPNGTLWVTWFVSLCHSVLDGQCGGRDRTNDVVLNYSTDGGETFGERILFDGYDSVFSNAAEGAKLAVNSTNNHGYLLVYDEVGNGLYDIFLLTFDTTQTLTTVQVSEGNGNGRSNDDDRNSLALASYQNHVCTAWEDVRSNYAIYGSCSADGGASFVANRAFSPSSAVDPHLAFAPDGTLYVTYFIGSELFLRFSPDFSATWSEPQQLSLPLQRTTSYYEWKMQVDASGALVVAFYEEEEVKLAMSLDQGRNFAITSLAAGGHTNFELVGNAEESEALVVYNRTDAERDVTDIWFMRSKLDTIPPSVPTELSAKAEDTSVRLQWQPATDANGIDGYHLLRASTATGNYEQLTSFPVADISYRDVGLESNGTTYFYKVYAVDGTGNVGDYSLTATATVSVGHGIDGLYGTIAYEQSPDGIIVRDLPGLNNERLLDAMLPQFSSDGTRLFYRGQAGLQSSLLNGSDSQLYYNEDDFQYRFDLAEDNNYFIASQRYYYENDNWALGRCTAYGVSLIRKQPYDRLYNDTKSIVLDRLAISPDQHWLLYTPVGYCGSGPQIYFDRKALCIVDLLNQSTSPCTPADDTADYDFSPDSQWVVFTAYYSGQREVWKARIQSSGVFNDHTQLTRTPPGQDVAMPSWSSDGNWIIFQRDIDPTSKVDYQLYIVRADGDSLRSLDLFGINPSWYGGGTSISLAAPQPGDQVYLPVIQR